MSEDITQAEGTKIRANEQLPQMQEEKKGEDEVQQVEEKEKTNYLSMAQSSYFRNIFRPEDHDDQVARRAYYDGRYISALVSSHYSLNHIIFPLNFLVWRSHTALWITLLIQMRATIRLRACATINTFVAGSIVVVRSGQQVKLGTKNTGDRSRSGG